MITPPPVQVTVPLAAAETAVTVSVSPRVGVGVVGQHGDDVGQRDVLEHGGVVSLTAIGASLSTLVTVTVTVAVSVSPAASAMV